jgi:hypothetical protein
VFGASGNPYPKGWLNPYRDAWHVLNLEPAETEASADEAPVAALG